jgi:hypothetical protein
MEYGVGGGAAYDDGALAGVGYTPAFSHAGAPKASGDGLGGVGAGLQGQREKNQQMTFQQQHSAEAPPPPLIKFNAPKLSTDARANRKLSEKKVRHCASPCTHQTAHATRHSHHLKLAESPSRSALAQAARLSYASSSLLLQAVFSLRATGARSLRPKAQEPGCASCGLRQRLCQGGGAAYTRRHRLCSRWSSPATRWPAAAAAAATTTARGHTHSTSRPFISRSQRGGPSFADVCCAFSTACWFHPCVHISACHRHLLPFTCR